MDAGELLPSSVRSADKNERGDNKMDKKAKSVIAIYAIVLAVYVLAFFVVPFPKIGASWICFIFTIISVVASLAVCGIAFRNGTTYTSRIYGVPIFKIGIVYAVTQIIVGIIICGIGAFLRFPEWVALLISIILLGVALIGVIVTDNARDIVEEVEEKHCYATKNMSCFQIDIAGIVECCEDSQTKEQLKYLNELFAFSDPVTGNETKAIEESIKTLLDSLQTAVANGDVEEIQKIAKQTTVALNKRNKICKDTKQC